MKCSRFGVALAAGIALGLWATAAVAKDEDPALTELVQILRNQGVLNDEQYTELSAKAASREAEESWTDRLSFWGDFRGRYEGFYYVEDDDHVPDRSRLRYRFRLNGRAEINPRAQVLFRLASGGDDNRSTNQTLGSAMDFDSDPIRIDRAYVRISPFVEGRLPQEGGSLWVEFGKVPNPYIWKVGKDFMLWDSDINLEGASILFENDVTENLNIFARTGYYVVQERSSNADPNLLAAQVGGHLRLSERFDVGTRLSWYRFGDLTAQEILRGADSSATPSVTSAAGNIPDGLNGQFGGRAFNVLETGFYLKARCLDDWPITVYGNLAGNLAAESSTLFPQAGKENIAWGLGAEIGDKKKVALIGVGYWQVQANAFFAQFIDSDLFDGDTNRKGFAFYGSKQIMDSTELTLTTFWSEPIDDSLPAFEKSASKADRVRVQADMVFKF